MTALTSSLRARQKGLEMTPEDGIAWSALKVCKEVQTDSEIFLKASSEEEEVIVVKSAKTRASLICWQVINFKFFLPPPLAYSYWVVFSLNIKVDLQSEQVLFVNFLQRQS